MSNKLKQLCCLIIGVVLIPVWTGCSWFDSPNDSIISPSSVEKTVSSLNLPDSYYSMSDDRDDIAGLIEGNNALTGAAIDEALRYTYNNGRNTFSMIALRLESEEDAVTLLGEQPYDTDPVSGLRMRSSVINLNIMGDPEDGINVSGSGYYLDKEYILFYDIYLESADSSVADNISSVFEGIGLADPVSQPMDIIV